MGAVSLSAALPPGATAKIVSHYRHHHGAESDLLAVARRPYPLAAEPYRGDADPDAAFEALEQELASFGVQVPVLYRQYAALCEPGGTRFLAVQPEDAGNIICRLEFLIRGGRAWGVRVGTRVFERD